MHFQARRGPIAPSVERTYMSEDKMFPHRSGRIRFSFVQEILELILQRQLIFVKSKRLQLTRERAGEFYREHQGWSSKNRLL